MPPAPLHLSARILRAFCLALTIAVFPVAAAADSNEILPLDQVRPGMQGYAYTIFAGDQVEKFDLEVIGVMPNFLGPKQSIILVQWKGPKVYHTCVVAGMSGSPVYLEGKLAGALSLKLGIFTKEPIAGVTPIEDILSPPSQNAAAQPSTQRFALPSESDARTGFPSGSALEPIETPLVFSGFQPAAIQQFANQLQGYGLVAAQGGTAQPRPEDAHLAAGDMAGMVLVQGDASINSACTVTAVQADRVYLCGHPFLNLGDVQIPMARSRVVTTLSSDLASTKIVNVGGSIGTITGDHQSPEADAAPRRHYDLQRPHAKFPVWRRHHASPFRRDSPPRPRPGSNREHIRSGRYSVARRPAHRPDHAKCFYALVRQYFRNRQGGWHHAASRKRSGQKIICH